MNWFRSIHCSATWVIQSCKEGLTLRWLPRKTPDAFFPCFSVWSSILSFIRWRPPFSIISSSAKSSSSRHPSESSSFSSFSFIFAKGSRLRLTIFYYAICCLFWKSKVWNIQSSSFSSFPDCANSYKLLLLSCFETTSFRVPEDCSKEFRPRNWEDGPPWRKLTKRLESAVSALSPEPTSHSSRSLHLPIPIICCCKVKSVLATIGWSFPLLLVWFN